MDPAKEEKDRKRSLRYSLYDGGFFSLMDGLTSVFISPYAIFLKSSNVVLSLLASVPDLISSMFQLTAIKVSEIVKSRRDVLVISALLQAIVWLPLLLLPYIGGDQTKPWLLLVFITAISMIGSFMSPLWRSMMGDMVNEHERGVYFSRRNQVIALVSFVSAFVA